MTKLDAIELLANHLLRLAQEPHYGSASEIAIIGRKRRKRCHDIDKPFALTLVIGTSGALRKQFGPGQVYRSVGSRNVDRIIERLE